MSHTTDERYERIPLDRLALSKTNPRHDFNQPGLDQLRDSIKDKGVVQPILVRPIVGARNGKQFEIVAGERRFRASLAADVADIPAIVRTLSDEQVLELQLIENIHRRDLTPLEQAKGYRALIDSNPTKHSAESIAQRIGMSPQWVWDRMKLNDLIPEAKKILDADRMSVGHAILIARLKPEDQKRAIHPAKNGTYGRDGDPGGLWTPEHAGLFDGKDEESKDPYAELKAVTVRELEHWINDHIRFDVTHAAKAAPLQFEAVAEKVKEAEVRPGRSRKVIAITFDHFTQPEARSEDERTYGPKSWKRADGTKKTTQLGYPSHRWVDSPTCEHSVLGVVAAGEDRGQAFDVCIARDKCEVHWKRELEEKRKREKAKASGKPTAEAGRRAAEERRAQREREAEATREQRWKAFRPALEKATRSAADKVPATLPKPVFAKLLTAYNLPAKTKPAQLAKALLGRALDQVFRHSWHGDEPRMVAWARLLKVDITACEPKPVQTSGEKAKDTAKGSAA